MFSSSIFIFSCLSFKYVEFILIWGFPGGSDGKVSACNVGDLGLIPGSGRSLGEGNSYPLQYSGLENTMDRGHRPWGRKESDTTERLSTHTYIYSLGVGGRGMVTLV